MVSIQAQLFYNLPFAVHGDPRCYGIVEAVTHGHHLKNASAMNDL